MNTLLSFSPEPFADLDHEAEEFLFESTSGEWETDEVEEEAGRRRRPRPARGISRGFARATSVRRSPKVRIAPQPMNLPRTPPRLGKSLRPIPMRRLIPPLVGLRPYLIPAPPRDVAPTDDNRYSEQARSEGSGSPQGTQPPEEPGSEYIRWVQDCLNKALGLQLAVDGIMTRETRSAVRSFQERQGLPITGLVGPETQDTLKAACTGSSAPVNNTELVSDTESEMLHPTSNTCPSCNRRSTMNYQLSFTPEPFSENMEFEEFETLDIGKYVYTGGWFINNEYLQWEEWQQNRLVFRFREEKRERGYILLNDASRNIYVLLPINGGRAYYAYGGDSWWTDLYDVTKMPIDSTVPGSTNFRNRAIKLLEPLPPLPQEITSNGPKRQIFTQMTGVTHERLKEEWARNINHTTCHDFVGWFARSMGSKTYLGRFDLDTFAKRSWVPASSGRTPKHGDILRFQSFHVGIALDLVDGKLNTAEGGQGGPIRGFDALKRKQYPWDPSKFKGWIDLEGWILGGG